MVQPDLVQRQGRLRVALRSLILELFKQRGDLSVCLVKNLRRVGRAGRVLVLGLGVLRRRLALLIMATVREHWHWSFPLVASVTVLYLFMLGLHCLV